MVNMNRPLRQVNWDGLSDFRVEPRWSGLKLPFYEIKDIDAEVRVVLEARPRRPMMAVPMLENGGRVAPTFINQQV